MKAENRMDPVLNKENHMGDRAVGAVTQENIARLQTVVYPQQRGSSHACGAVTTRDWIPVATSTSPRNFAVEG